MTKYIEREALEVALNHRLNFLMAECGEYDHYTSGFDEAVTRVEDFPAADVAPVRHGRWEHTDLAVHWTAKDKCSECGYHSRYRDDLTDFIYCPNCGAKMDGDEE